MTDTGTTTYPINTADDSKFKTTSAGAADEGKIPLLDSDGNIAINLADGTGTATDAAPTADTDIANKKYVDNTSSVKTIVGTTEKNSNNTFQFTNSATYVKKKEIEVNKKLNSYRITWQMGSDGSASTVYGRIYINGVAVGVEQATTVTVGSGYATISEDFTEEIAVGDLIQLYIKNSGAAACAVQNLKILYDLDVVGTFTNQDPV